MLLYRALTFNAMYRTIPSFYCQESFIDVILPAIRFKSDVSGEWLIIGSPGVDGIEFRMKKNDKTSVFAYYPYENEHIKVADSPEELIKKWKEGSLKV